MNMGWPTVPINGFNIFIDDYGVRIFGTRPNPGQPEAPLIAVELATSPLLAKVLAIKLRKTILAHEDKVGEFTMTEDLAHREGINLEQDWETWRPPREDPE